VAHYVAGVIPESTMLEVVDGFATAHQFQIGDRVRSSRGSLQGVVVALEGSTVTIKLDETNRTIRSNVATLMVDRAKPSEDAPTDT
jgi:hypothetical protein